MNDDDVVDVLQALTFDVMPMFVRDRRNQRIVSNYDCFGGNCSSHNLSATFSVDRTGMRSIHCSRTMTVRSAASSMYGIAPISMASRGKRETLIGLHAIDGQGFPI